MRLHKNWMVWCLVLIVCMTGCVNPFAWLRSSGSPKAPTESKKYHNWDETVTIKPALVTCGDCGKTTVVNETTKKLSVTFKDEKKEAPLTLWQRMCRWFGSFGTFGVIFVIVSLVFFQGAPLIFVIKRMRSGMGALKQVVKAVKESGVVSEGNGLHDALSSNLSRASKELVGKIKAQL